MIIDMHVHSASFSQEDNLPAVMNECRKNGVGLVLVSALADWSRYPDADKVRRANEQAQDFVARSEGHALWLAYINPQNNNWKDELDRCIAADRWPGGTGPAEFRPSHVGGKGSSGGDVCPVRSRTAIGVKMWTSLKDERGSLDNADAVVAYAASKGLPVLIHTWDRTGPNLPGEMSLEELAGMAERCPSATLIGAHSGGNWRQTAEMLPCAPPNLHVDVCGSFPEKGMVDGLAAGIGAERMLFGSDMLGRSLPSQLAKVLLADIPESDKELILWKNAQRIFRLESIPQFADEGTSALPKAQLPSGAEEHFCFCGRWPFFEPVCATTDDLERALADTGIEKAYAASLDSMFRLDLGGANRQFLQACSGKQRIAPLATINLAARNRGYLLDSLDKGFAGVFVSPFAHNWRLSDPAHADFFARCAEKSLPVWINGSLGDIRMCHSAIAYRDVTRDELAEFVANAPRNSYVFQGVTWVTLRGVLDQVRGKEWMKFEISRLTDTTGGMDQAVEEGLLPQLVMGSEFPLRDIRQVRSTLERL